MISLAMGSCATTPSRTETSEVVEIKAAQPKKKYQIVDHKYFIVYYDNQYRLARWVKYELTKDLLIKNAKRRNAFKADPLLKSEYAVMPKEYKKTGYDQGHLAPSADFAFSQEANDETFVMSNMVPQKPKLNRVAWRMLEDQVRKWACGEEKITVITGPIFSAKMEHLPSGLAIPEDFFKIVFDETPPRKAIAFLYHQSDATNVMKDRIVDLKKIDALTGEDFSSHLKNEERRPAQAVDWKECVP
jgi:endonuclease G